MPKYNIQGYYEVATIDVVVADSKEEAMDWVESLYVGSDYIIDDSYHVVYVDEVEE